MASGRLISSITCEQRFLSEMNADASLSLHYGIELATNTKITNGAQCAGNRDCSRTEEVRGGEETASQLPQKGDSAMEPERTNGSNTGGQDHNQSHGDAPMYLRFGAMILTSMVVMYAVMYMAAWEWSHLSWSTSRLFMALAMGGTMGLVMLGWMLNMYRNVRWNIAVVAVSLLLLVGAIYLDRSQTIVGDNSFMSAMIPHHSMAITRAERFNVTDARVCDLALEISEAQRREILEMEWLMDDIEQNGPATTAAEADERAVPDFEVSAERQCPPD
jgi:hypothetical protein